MILERELKLKFGDMQDIQVYDSRNIDMQIADEVVKAIHNIRCTNISEQTRATEMMVILNAFITNYDEMKEYIAEPLRKRALKRKLERDNSTVVEEERIYQEHKKQRYEKEINKPIWKNFRLKGER